VSSEEFSIRDDEEIEANAASREVIPNCIALDVLLALRDGGIGRDLDLELFCDPHIGDSREIRAKIFDLEKPFGSRQDVCSTYLLLHLSIRALDILTSDLESVSLDFESDSVWLGGAGNDLRIWDLIDKAAGEDTELREEASQRMFNEVLLRTSLSLPSRSLEEVLQFLLEADPGADFDVDEIRALLSEGCELDTPVSLWTPKRGDAARSLLRSELIGADSLLDKINDCESHQLARAMLWLCFFFDKEVGNDAADEAFLGALGRLNCGVYDFPPQRWSLNESRLLNEVMRCRMIWFARLFDEYDSEIFFNGGEYSFAANVCGDFEDLFVDYTDLGTLVEKIQSGELWGLSPENPEDPYPVSSYEGTESLDLAMIIIRWSEKVGSIETAANDLWYWLNRGFEASEALDWMLCGVELPQAIRERRAGRSPDETHGALWALGIKPTKAALQRWRGLGKYEISNAIDRGFKSAAEYLPFAQSTLDVDVVESIRKAAKRNLSPSEVLRFHDLTRQGLNSTVALRWLKSDEFDVARIGLFEKNGISAPKAKSWKLAGFSLTETIWFNLRGVDNSDVGVEWLALSGNLVELERWINGGRFSPSEARSWRDAEFSPEDAARWAAIGASPREAGKWQDLGKLPSDLESWIQNDFTPAEACRWVTSDPKITPTLALRRRRAGIQPR
jgi:hypothetical protein